MGGKLWQLCVSESMHGVSNLASQIITRLKLINAVYNLILNSVVEISQTRSDTHVHL